jgi:hypothetical protein
MKHLITFFIVSLLLNSCNLKSGLIKDENYILGIWRLAESSGKSNSKNNDPLLNEAENLQNVKNGKVLSIFPDNTFTELSGDGIYSFGTWKWIEEEEIICFQKGKNKEIFELKSVELETKKIQIELTNKKSKSKYIQEAFLLKDFKEEPFYSENNFWRLKANRLENEKELKERLGNFFKHMVYILKAADTRKLEVISFEFSMGIIKIYNGGIGIVDIYDIPEIWKKTYYNEEQLEEVHDMFSDYLQINRYRGAGTGNWVKDDYRILLSIYGDLKSDKF